MLKECFAVPPTHFPKWRDALILIFQVRNDAGHPDAGLQDPLPHPGVRAAVPRAANVYRLDNATRAVELALWTALKVRAVPRSRLGASFRDHAAGWMGYAGELRDYREAVRTASTV
jgi:hypothetical protein